MVLKYTVITMFLLIILYGLWYTFEFINPWIAIIASILIGAFITDRVIKTKTNN